MHFPIAFIAQITPKTLVLVVYVVAVFREKLADSLV
jgi:hypothetical protein